VRTTGELSISTLVRLARRGAVREVALSLFSALFTAPHGQSHGQNYNCEHDRDHDHDDSGADFGEGSAQIPRLLS
jgi:hypothetical protein